MVRRAHADESITRSEFSCEGRRSGASLLELRQPARCRSSTRAAASAKLTSAANTVNPPSA